MSKKLTIEFIISKANVNNPKTIRALNLRGNKISDISILSELTSLEIISLNSNQIKDISAFKKLKNVREIYLRDNQISDFSQLENLKNCKKLEKLAIKDNPVVANISNYYQKIIEILPQLKKIDDIEIKQLKLNNSNNFNSPLSKKDSNQSNNYNIQSPNLPKNNSNNKSGSESISSDRRGEGNDSAAPDPQQSLSPPNLSDNLNINDYNLNNNNNKIEVIDSYNAINLKLNNKNDKSDLLNKSFKKKITEGSFRKVKKNKNNLNNNINQEEKKKQLIERAINNDNKLKTDKLSQTISSGFYKNPFKNNIDGSINEIGGYKKKIIGNFKQEQEHKENNKNKQNVINTVFKKYQFFDNDNDNEEEKKNKKKNNESPEKIIFKKSNKLNPLISASKKNESLEKRIDLLNHNNNLEKIKNENKIIENGKEENINKSVVESIKLLMTTLSVEGLKQIQNDIQKLIESKN